MSAKSSRCAPPSSAARLAVPAWIVRMSKKAASLREARGSGGQSLRRRGAPSGARGLHSAIWGADLGRCAEGAIRGGAHPAESIEYFAFTLASISSLRPSLYLAPSTMALRCALFLCVPGMKMVEPLRAHHQHKGSVAQSDQESGEVGDHMTRRAARS